jgi:hypothetical protein
MKYNTAVVALLTSGAFAAPFASISDRSPSACSDVFYAAEQVGQVNYKTVANYLAACPNSKVVLSKVRLN